MNEDSYLTFLAISVLIVVVDGQILYRSGKGYLARSYGDSEASTSMTRLVVVLFHLVVLGVIALISTIDIGGSGVQAVVARLGVVLLIVALAHFIAVSLLTRIRESQLADSRVIEQPRDRDRQSTYDPVVAPVADQERPPQVARGLDDGGPYSTSQ
ncbi:MAG: hypothetical protein ACRDQW_05610 [Haloechinothrix sp.]